MKDYIDSEKRCKQFIFYIKFNHLFSWGTEWRYGSFFHFWLWTFLVLLVKKSHSCSKLWGAVTGWSCFLGGEANKSLSIANKDQDHSCVEWQLHATWHFSDVHAKVFLFSGIFFRRCFHPEWFATWLCGEGGFTNFYVRSQLKFMRVQSLVSACLIPFRMYEFE